MTRVIKDINQTKPFTEIYTARDIRSLQLLTFSKEKIPLKNELDNCREIFGGIIVG